MMKLKDYRKSALFLHFSVLLIAIAVLLLPGYYINNEARAQPFTFAQPSSYDEYQPDSYDEYQPDSYDEYQPDSSYEYQTDSFEEQVLVNVDLSYEAVDVFGVIIHNDNTNVEAIEFYPDDGSYPRQTSIPGYIVASAGDPLTTCVMNMITEEIACSTQTANNDGMATEFNIDLNDAQSVSSQPYDQFDDNDVQRYIEECPYEL
jgi:hypothetical protein